MTDPEAARAVIETPTAFDAARAVADAVLYEGYLLYPYRRSSGKNQVRWQFGVLAPRRWVEARGPVADSVAGSAESWWQQTECLLEAPETAVVHVRLRYLQVQAKAVEELLPDGGYAPVERLDLGGHAEVPFDEAVPREVDIVLSVRDLLGSERRVSVDAPASEWSEDAFDDRGVVRGRVTRTRWPVRGLVRLTADTPLTPFPTYRLRVRVENSDEETSVAAPRHEALRRCLISTHTMYALNAGAFISLLDPPAWAAREAKACVNVRTFPVLAGPDGTRDLVLASPIILYDHPRVAPESPGDLHDASEIDEILSLRTLTLTDDEKQEARATDPRAAAIVDRVDSMPPEVMERLHGAIRSLRPARRTEDTQDSAPARPEVPWWNPGADASVSPDTDSVLVDGVAVAKGSRVRLRPRRRGSDAHDMFLAGRTATVEAVFLDVDGAQHVAVTIDDDPSAELHQWYGRYHYFAPEEVEPLGEKEVRRE